MKFNFYLPVSADDNILMLSKSQMHDQDISNGKEWSTVR